MDLTFFLEAILATVNLFSLAAFGVDKMKSMRGGWRIAESRLLLAAFLGPFGALTGMFLFRHKTRKAKFTLVPAFAIFQVVFISYFLFR